MIGVFRASGFPVEIRSGAGELHVTIVDARVRLEPPHPERPYAALGGGGQRPAGITRSA